MKFEEALPLMRKGVPMSRRVDPRRTRIRIVEVDGTDCLVARNANQTMPSIVAVNANDVLADDWERSDTLDQETGGEE